MFETAPGAPLQQIPNSPENNINLLGIRSTFNPDSNLFSWEATFAPEAGVDAAVSLPTGFILVVNEGGHPAGHVGELAAVFLDASDPTDPIVTAYAYNGREPVTAFEESISSFYSEFGGPDADRIISSLNDNGGTSFLLDAASVDNADGSRTLSIYLDTTPLQNFDPTTGNNPLGSFDIEEDTPLPEGFQGLKFSAEIGIWFQPFVVDADYFTSGPNAGFIEDFARGDRALQALYDEEALPTVLIPEPVSVALFAVPALFVLRRRKTV
ncbi:MAG: hypothetical protein AAGH99_00625 [Planctomycetota bacterium]